MCSSLEAIAAAIGAQEDANTNSQLSSALFAISLVGRIIPLQQAWMGTLSKDTEWFYHDTLVTGSSQDKAPTPTPDPSDPTATPYPHNGLGPCMAPIAAMDNEQKTLDTNQSDQETNNVDTLVSTAKTQTEFLGNNLSQVFSLETPVLELLSQLRTTVNSIK